MSVKEFSESAIGFTRSPLGIIALFIVLVYGLASVVVGFGKNVSAHISPLIYFMVLFPVLVFSGFLWLVAKHHRKLYGPGDYKDEKHFLAQFTEEEIEDYISDELKSENSKSKIELNRLIKVAELTPFAAVQQAWNFVDVQITDYLISLYSNKIKFRLSKNKVHQTLIELGLTKQDIDILKHLREARDQGIREVDEIEPNTEGLINYIIVACNMAEKIDNLKANNFASSTKS